MNDCLKEREIYDWVTKASNSFDNSYYPLLGHSVEEKMLKLIDESEIELTQHDFCRNLAVFLLSN